MIDTRNKRASVVGALPDPDATIAVEDRRMIAWIYAGTLSAPALAAGLVSAAYAVEHPGMAFSVQQPGISMDVLQPGITFSSGN